MTQNFPKNSKSNNGGWVEMTNSHPTCPESIINCCFDWLKIVFPFSTKEKYKIVTTYQDLYQKLRVQLPELTDNEIFKIIELDFPDVQPGIKYQKDNEQLVNDPDTNVWSLHKIKTVLEHWLKLEKFIPDSSNESIKKIGSFSYLQEYSPGITFMFDGPEMDYVYEGKTYRYKTCCIELKGEGCRKVEENNVDLITFIKNIFKIPGFHATRIDFAIDLINDSKITMEWLKKKIFEDVMWSGTFREARPVPHYKFITNGIKESILSGDGIEFGSKSSTSRLNIYDKKLEREANTGFDVTIDSWIRFELQCFKVKANNVINTLMKELLLKSFNKFCSELILGALDIKVNFNLHGDENYRPGKIRTWPTDPLWAEFLGTTEKIELKSQAKLETDFVKTRQWFNRSGMSTQVKLDMLYEEDPKSKIESLERQIEILEEFDDSDLDQFNTYRQKRLGALDRLNYEDINKHKERLQAELNYLKKLYNMEE